MFCTPICRISREKKRGGMTFSGNTCLLKQEECVPSASITPNGRGFLFYISTTYAIVMKEGFSI